MVQKYAHIVAWGIACVLLCARVAAGQPAFQKLLRFERVEGLPHHSIMAITQDSDGFIWLGTADGLVRYDGYEFVVYRHDPRDTTSLSHSTVTALLEDTAGRLWVGTENGLNRFDRKTGRFVHHSIQPPGQIAGVQALFEENSGTLWIGLACGLVRYEPATGQTTPHGCKPERAQQPAFYRHQQGVDGLFWSGTSQRRVAQGLYRLTPSTGRYQHIAVPASWQPERAVSVVVGATGRIWIGTPHTAVGWFDPAGERFKRLPIEGGEVWHEDREGGLWMETEGGLARYDPATDDVVQFRLEPGDPGALTRDVRAVYEDRAGTLWVGTLGGLFRYDHRTKPFQHLRHDPDDPHSLSSNTVMAIHEDTDSKLWVGTLGGGLNRIPKEGILTTYRHHAGNANSLCDDKVWAVHRDRQGTLWIGTDGGLCRYDEQADRFAMQLLPADLPYVNTIAENPNGPLWIGGEHLYRLPLDGGRAERFAPDDGRIFGNIQAIYPADNGIVWLGTEFSGLWRFEIATGRFQPYPIAGQKGGLFGKAVRTIHPSRDGRYLWLGADLGLVRFDLETATFDHYLEREGLPGSNVFGILEDESGLLWVSTNQGLARFDPRTETFRTYVDAEGTGNTEYNRRAALAGPTGVFYFGGLGGLTAFRPATVREGTAPPVVITRVQKAGRDGSIDLHTARVLQDGLVLYPHEQSVAFEFAALSFAQPQQNRYAYRLEGFDAGWVDAGARRYARYVGVPPGHYTFRVRGRTSDGMWNDEGAVVAVTILPPFWQTWWFRLLVAALALAVLYAGYRYRVASLLREERLRLRIASDLHDDIGSKLSSIALMTDVVTRRSPLDDQARRQLAEVSGVARRMVDDLRDIVWMINPRHDRLEDLVAKMQHLAATMLDGTAYTFQCPPDAFTEILGMEQRRHLFLLYKEILHNVARHAQATQVAITVERHDGTLVLDVRDDGIGFDPSAVHTGTGLQSACERARALGSHLAVESQSGTGTHVCLTVRMAESRDGFLGC